MLRLLVLLLVIFVIVYAFRQIRNGIRAARPAQVAYTPPPRAVGRHAWRIEEEQGKKSVTIEVAHPTKGTRRTWRLDRGMPDFDAALRAARTEAEVLHAELRGSL